jgi:hypothetical protein
MTWFLIYALAGGLVAEPYATHAECHIAARQRAVEMSPAVVACMPIVPGWAV